MSRRQLPQQITKITIPERGSGKSVIRYEVRADAGINPETGKRHQVKRRYRAEQEARAGLVKFLADAAAGEFVARKDVTVVQICADWFGSLHWGRATTIAGYEYNLAPLREAYGPLPVQKLTRKHVDDLVSALKAGGTTTAKGNVRRPWSARSLKRTVETTAMVLDYAKDNGAGLRQGSETRLAQRCPVDQAEVGSNAQAPDLHRRRGIDLPDESGRRS